MKISFSNTLLIGLLFGALSLSSCSSVDQPQQNPDSATAQPLLDENTLPTTGDVINRAVYMALQANLDYRWDGSVGELPQIIPGAMAFDLIQWNSMEIDPAIPDYLHTYLQQPQAKAVLIAGVPATDGSGQTQSHIYIDLRNSPEPKPYQLEGAPGISLADVATPNAGCNKRIIHIGYDGPAQNFCGCMPHYACYDNCQYCHEVGNIREFVLEQMGPHPLLDIEVPYQTLEPGVELASLYP